jgi:ubiquitin C-terminal hydrolase
MTSNRSIIDKVFAGQITSTVTCNKCGEDFNNYLPFIDICLELNEQTLEGCFKKHFDQ